MITTKLIDIGVVPGTDVTITIVRRTKRLSETSECRVPVYIVERRPNGAQFVNYLSCGRDSLAEARAEANFLWSDTVTRRDTYHVAKQASDRT